MWRSGRRDHGSKRRQIDVADGEDRRGAIAGANRAAGKNRCRRRGSRAFGDQMFFRGQPANCLGKFRSVHAVMKCQNDCLAHKRRTNLGDSRRSALGGGSRVRHLASEFYRLALSRSKDFR